jgi:GT2 family glycosyltransferase
MPTDAVDLPVLIVSFRAADLLEKCLISVKAFHPGQDVLIWDNTGPDTSEILELAERFPEFRWYFSERNIGFAAAVNRLADLVPERNFLLLNPDAELVAPLEKTLVLVGQPRVAAAGPMIADEGFGAPVLLTRQVNHRYRGTTPWDSCYRKLTYLNALGGAAGLGRRLRGSPFSSSYRLPPREVDGYISGCCLAIRREAWDELGPFDEEFFLYGEEAHWQRKANARGWKIWLADEVAARHSPRGTVRGDWDWSRRSADLLRSNQVLQVEHIYGRGLADFFLAWSSLFDSVRRLVHRTSASASASASTSERGDFLVTADGPNQLVRSRIATALALEQAGYRVTVVSLQRLGILASELPPSIRLVRMVWWWPWFPGERLPSMVVSGETGRERGFTRLLRLRRGLVSVTSVSVTQR